MGSHQAFYERFKIMDYARPSKPHMQWRKMFSVSLSQLGSVPAVDEIDRAAFMSERALQKDHRWSSA
jgi:hypothetical protein